MQRVISRNVIHSWHIQCVISFITVKYCITMYINQWPLFSKHFFPVMNSCPMFCVLCMCKFAVNVPSAMPIGNCFTVTIKSQIPTQLNRKIAVFDDLFAAWTLLLDLPSHLQNTMHLRSTFKTSNTTNL